jgi:hypothetical protein
MGRACCLVMKEETRNMYKILASQAGTLRNRFRGCKVDRSNSGPYPMADFGRVLAC